MQKVYKRKVPKVYKNKKLNNANFGTYNLNDYQTFLLLVSKLGKTNADGTYVQEEVLERTHTVTGKEFSEAFGIDLSGVYKVLQRAGKRIANTAITIERPELFETWEIPIGVAKYNYKEGSLTVTFTAEILPYLAQVKKKFILYNLKEVANFGSLYSTRLYELIQEFKDTGWLVKSVAQLREVFAVGKKFPLYANFKAKTFAHAVEEINSQYPTMKLRFEEIKEGRKVVSIDFRFTPSTIIEQYNPVTKQVVSVTQKPKQVQPKRKELTPEEKKAKEIRAQIKKLEKEEKEAIADIVKKYGNDRSIDYDAAYAVKTDQEQEEIPIINPNQQELDL